MLNRPIADYAKVYYGTFDKNFNRDEAIEAGSHQNEPIKLGTLNYYLSNLDNNRLRKLQSIKRIRLHLLKGFEYTELAVDLIISILRKIKEKNLTAKIVLKFPDDSCLCNEHIKSKLIPLLFTSDKPDNLKLRFEESSTENTADITKTLKSLLDNKAIMLSYDRLTNSKVEASLKQHKKAAKTTWFKHGLNKAIDSGIYGLKLPFKLVASMWRLFGKPLLILGIVVTAGVGFSILAGGITATALLSLLIVGWPYIAFAAIVLLAMPVIGMLIGGIVGFCKGLTHPTHSVFASKPEVVAPVSTDEIIIIHDDISNNNMPSQVPSKINVTSVVSNSPISASEMAPTIPSVVIASIFHQQPVAGLNQPSSELNSPNITTPSSPTSSVLADKSRMFQQKPVSAPEQSTTGPENEDEGLVKIIN